MRLTVTAFSRGNGLLMRVGGPIARRQQARATTAYLDALERHVEARGQPRPISFVMPWSRPAVYPPSTGMAAPDTNEASSDSR